MSRKPASIQRHAIFKHPYRRAVAARPDFHSLDGSGRWAALRDQVIADAARGAPNLLDVMDSRATRRDEVLAALEHSRATAGK